MDLEGYRKDVSDLYDAKGWNTDWRWLITGYFAESGELIQSIIKKEDKEVIAEEFADVMHYLLELMNVSCKETNIDSALTKKINSNKVNKKKTTDEKGNVVYK